MIRSIVKRLKYLVIDVSLLGKLKKHVIKSSDQALVINLHRTSPDKNPFWPPMSPDIFESLLRFLADNFEVCHFREIKGRMRSKKPLAVLSFDDGYYDFIEFALPLLEKYRMPANMNIIPECAESTLPIWNVQLYDFLNSAPRCLINEIRLPNFDVHLAGESDEEKLRYGLRISRYLKMKPRSDREELWRMLQPILERAEIGFTRMMSADEIKNISNQVEIGAHSYSHESMGFESFDFFKEDFLKCRKYFSEVLELPLETYAFPNGSYRAEQIGYLREEKIHHILLVDEKIPSVPTDVYTRLTVYGETKREVRLRALGF